MKKEKGMTKLKDKIFNNFNMAERSVDFMGYSFTTKRELTFHHIQPKNYGGKTTYANGSLLIRPSHNYIHIIEAYDYKLFLQLSRELLDEHQDGAITPERIARINELLEYFEDKYRNSVTARGTLLIQEEFIRRRKQ